MIQTKAKLIYNTRVKNNYWYGVFNAPSLAKKAAPGQFVNIKLSDDYEPLLRRPFSIHRVTGYGLGVTGIEILYEIVGRGTEALSQKKPGEPLDIIGPLGNGFNYRIPYPASRIPILVAGGIGVAPLLFLAEKLKTYNLKLTTVLIGASTKSQILCAKEFKELGFDVKIATDDGSQGFKGKVTDLLRQILLKNPMNSKQPKNSIYACGPKPMLAEISRISRQCKIPAQISLEEHLACGIGACLGCVINTVGGYQRVCKEGPVFNAEEIIW